MTPPHTMVRSCLLVATVAAANAVLSCGAGGVAQAIRPRETTATAAMGEDAACRELEAEAHPLVVDWRPEDRGDLEIAMKEGVAVVSYDCRSIRMLRDCKIAGQYGFVGTSLKEKVLRLENSDELKANLPFSGAAIAGKISAELARNATLDIALVMVGRTTTTWREATPGDLVGDCDKATHFVRAAYLGAFAMATGTKANVAAAAQLFGASTSGASASAQSVQTKDGSLDECRQASSDAKAPPGKCSAMLRLELTAIRAQVTRRAGAASGAKKEDEHLPDPKPIDDGCPRTMVLSEGKCTAASGATRFACDPSDAVACAAQCDKGDAQSCFNLAYLYDEGKGVATDDVKANALYDKACGAGFLRGCVQLAQYYGDEDKTPDYPKAVAYATKACDGGEPEGCTALGVLTFFGNGTPKNNPKATALYLRACDAGDPHGCRRAGYMYGRGLDDVPVDYAKSVDLDVRGCDGGLVWGCIDAVNDLLRGGAVAHDPKRALAINQRLCDRYPEHCQFLGLMYARGEGTWRDDARALAAFAKGCEAKSDRACAFEAAFRLEGRGAPADEENAFEALAELCKKGEMIACDRGAYAYQIGKGVKKDPKRAFGLLSKMCSDTSSYMACTDAGLSLLYGIGTAVDKRKATSALESGCRDDMPWSERDPRACKALAEIKAATRSAP